MTATGRYKCASCGVEFTALSPDREECKVEFGLALSAAARARVCDPCYKKILASYPVVVEAKNDFRRGRR